MIAKARTTVQSWQCGAMNDRPALSIMKPTPFRSMQPNLQHCCIVVQQRLYFPMLLQYQYFISSMTVSAQTKPTRLVGLLLSVDFREMIRVPENWSNCLWGGRSRGITPPNNLQEKILYCILRARLCNVPGGSQMPAPDRLVHIV